jgi:hypothetical protein
MSGPYPEDVGQRTITMSTVEDLRQYGQSAWGTWSMSDRGHKQGAVNDDDQPLRQGPFEADLATGQSRLQQLIDTQIYGEPVQEPEGAVADDTYGYELGASDADQSDDLPDNL